MSFGLSRKCLLLFRFPFPVADFRQILPVLADVLLVLNQFVLELLLQIDALVSCLRQAVDGVLCDKEFSIWTTVSFMLDGPYSLFQFGEPARNWPVRQKASRFHDRNNSAVYSTAT
jgi:hypothetical protein